MNEILEKTIHLGCLIRDSPEGREWRDSRSQLDKIPLNSRGKDLFTLQIPMSENLSLIHQANRVRPLLLPLLVIKNSPHMNHDAIRQELRKNQRIWKSYRQLELCTAFTGIIVTFLRGIAPGYPHSDLIYTMKKSVWMEISSYKELPWDMASSLLPENAMDARQIGLERVMPLTAPVISDGLNLIAEAIKKNAVWLELDKAYRAIARQKNLQKELQRAKQQFAREFSPYQNHTTSVPTRVSKFEDLVNQIYSTRGKRILTYVEKFLEYEWLVERIYWLLSQLIIFEHITCVTTASSQQLQQVLLSSGKQAFMTGLAKTRGTTLAIGQLIHATFPETDNVADGLYQIENLQQKYDPATGVHILFRSRNLWYCKLSSLLSVTENYEKQTCLQNEMPDVISGTMISIMEGAEVIDTLKLGEFIGFKFRDTMYLP